MFIFHICSLFTPLGGGVNEQAFSCFLFTSEQPVIARLSAFFVHDLFTICSFVLFTPKMNKCCIAIDSRYDRY